METGDRLPRGRDADYCQPMRCAPRLLSACLAALLLTLAGGALSPASAQDAPVTVQIFADYVADREIDGHYAPDDLRAALEIASGDGGAYDEFSAAVQDTFDRDILGLSTDAGPAPVDDGGSILTLPEPRGPGERDQPPWPFLALSALAAALVVTGAGSSILRRVRR